MPDRQFNWHILISVSWYSLKHWSARSSKPSWGNFYSFILWSNWWCWRRFWFRFFKRFSFRLKGLSRSVAQQFVILSGASRTFCRLDTTSNRCYISLDSSFKKFNFTTFFDAFNIFLSFTNIFTGSFRPANIINSFAVFCVTYSILGFAGFIRLSWFVGFDRFVTSGIIYCSCIVFFFLNFRFLIIFFF